MRRQKITEVRWLSQGHVVDGNGTQTCFLYHSILNLLSAYVASNTVFIFVLFLILRGVGLHQAGSTRVPHKVKRWIQETSLLFSKNVSWLSMNTSRPHFYHDICTWTDFETCCHMAQTLFLGKIAFETLKRFISLLLHQQNIEELMCSSIVKNLVDSKLTQTESCKIHLPWVLTALGPLLSAFGLFGASVTRTSQGWGHSQWVIMCACYTSTNTWVLYTAPT